MLRPTILVLINLFVSLMIAACLSAIFPTPRRADEVDRLAARISGLKYPARELSPDDVVRIQLEACADDDWGRGALQCMCFASPANRAITGPFDRFGRMLRSPPYAACSAPDSILIGKPKLIGRTARVFVTIVKGKKVSAFVWLLRQQTEPPLAGCWMTEVVFPVDHKRGKEKQSSENLEKVASIAG